MIVNTYQETRLIIELTRGELKNLLIGKDLEEPLDLSIEGNRCRAYLYCSDPIDSIMEIE